MTAQTEEKKSGGLLHRALKGLWLGVSALILPFDIKLKSKYKIAFNNAKVTIFAFAYFIAQPAATFLFPRAEEVLKEKGLRTELAEELAPGKTVYVREDNIWGKLHAAMDRPLIALPFVESLWSKDVRAYAYSNKRFLWISTPVLYIKNDEQFEVGSGDLVRADDGTALIELDPSRQFPTNEENRQATLLHEIRHCADENMKMKSELQRESDADCKAVLILARELNKPALLESFVDLKVVFNVAKTHDTALYLDAVFNGTAVPTAEEQEKANAEAAPLYDILNSKRVLHVMDACDRLTQKEKDICNYDAAAENPGMSDLALRRAFLYERAQEKWVGKPQVKTASAGSSKVR